MTIPQQQLQAPPSRLQSSRDTPTRSPRSCPQSTSCGSSGPSTSDSYSSSSKRRPPLRSSSSSSPSSWSKPSCLTTSRWSCLPPNSSQSSSRSSSSDPSLRLAPALTVKMRCSQAYLLCLRRFYASAVKCAILSRTRIRSCFIFYTIACFTRRQIRQISISMRICRQSASPRTLDTLACRL